MERFEENVPFVYTPVLVFDETIIDFVIGFLQLVHVFLMYANIWVLFLHYHTFTDHLQYVKKLLFKFRLSYDNMSKKDVAEVFIEIHADFLQNSKKLRWHYMILWLHLKP